MIGRFLRITQASGLSSNRVESALVELPDGRILVSPQGGSMNIIVVPDDGKPAISSLNIPGNRAVSWILKDEKGFIWISCNDKSIFIFNPSSLSFELLYNGYQFTSLIEKTGKYISTKFSQALGPMAIPDIRSDFIDSTRQIPNNIITHGKEGSITIYNRFPLKRVRSAVIFTTLIQ